MSQSTTDVILLHTNQSYLLPESPKWLFCFVSAQLLVFIFIQTYFLNFFPNAKMFQHFPKTGGLLGEDLPMETIQFSLVMKGKMCPNVSDGMEL